MCRPGTRCQTVQAGVTAGWPVNSSTDHRQGGERTENICQSLGPDALHAAGRKHSRRCADQGVANVMENTSSQACINTARHDADTSTAVKRLAVIWYGTCKE